MLPLIVTPLISEGIKTAVKPTFKKFIEPHFNHIKEWLHQRKLEHKVDLFETQFTEYLTNVFINTQFINVLIFPNEQISLDEFYEPLKITIRSTRESYTIDHTNLDFLVKYNRIIISDTAGMGKSTLMKWITRQCVTRFLGVPLLIELRKITPHNDLMQEIFLQLGQLGKEVDQEFIIQLLAIGKFIIIFDGYDEIVRDYRGFVTDEILRLVNKAHQNYFILTSRPDPSLTTFGNFKKLSIESLNKAQYSSIINKCDKISTLGIANDLINEIQNRGSGIEGFLSNPFLVTLLYNCYVYNRNIPVRKSSFYDEIYTALFKHHDLSKDKYERIKASGLDIYNFRLVLRKFAFDSARTGTTDFSETTLIEGIRKAQEALVGIPQFNSLDFVDDLIKQVPLMVREGLHIKWSHKSLQDYFAAESVCNNENKTNIIVSLSNSRNFYGNYNLFDFVVEMDYATVRNEVLYNILKSYKSHVERVKSLSYGITEKDAIERAGLLFDTDVFIQSESRGNAFPQINELTGKEITSYSIYEFIDIQGKDASILIANGNTTDILSIIEQKGMEDIFHKHSTTRFIENEVYPIESLKDKLVYLNSDTVLQRTSKAFQAALDSILRATVNHTLLDYDKVNIALEDIELKRKKKKDDDDQLFQ